MAGTGLNISDGDNRQSLNPVFSVTSPINFGGSRALGTGSTASTPITQSATAAPDATPGITSQTLGSNSLLKPLIYAAAAIVAALIIAFVLKPRRKG